MALNSVNTNVGAMIALQNLQVTNKDLSTVQNRISTGKAVASAKDNGAIWAIAQGQRAEMGALNAVKDSLNRGQSAVDVALSAGESVSDLLIQLKEKALAAKDTSLSTDARAALASDFDSIRDQIGTVVANAKFNGVNLLDGTATNGFKALANAAGSSTIDVASQTMTLAALAITASTLSTATLAGTALTAVDSAIADVSSKLAKLGTGSKAFGTQLTFVGKLQDALESGIGNLVDADLAKESARLQALQTKQQLGVQALSIANSSTSMLLGLFR
ncbi:flagellin [Brevundimonas sp.]|jgi:flagellin|uniref:flagellin n=1 Tax=Brevundimonas sp. TaxID=1871086 RepID=UPI002FC615F9